MYFEWAVVDFCPNFYLNTIISQAKGKVKQNDASSVALLSIPFAVAYAIIMLTVLAVNSLINKNNRENKSEYTSVYTKNK